MKPVALTIAGSDPSGGAGIQADLKTFHQFGVYGEAVITLVTVQNTQRVSRVECLPAELVLEQLQAVLEDIPPQAAKTGALGNAAIIEALAQAAERFTFPLVVDPVMVSKHGAPLLAPEARKALQDRLLPLAYLVTPNIPEAEVLTGLRIRTVDDMRKAAEQLCQSGTHAVVVKGGHMTGEAVDVLCVGRECHLLATPRVSTPHTHGTGCTFSAAITAALARGLPLREAVEVAKRYLYQAIQTQPGLGHGSGPVNHHAPVEWIS